MHESLKLDNQLCFALYAATRAMTKRYKPLLDPFGLTYPQYLVLLVLFETDHVPVKTLGEKLFLDSGTLTPLLKRMASAGLVNRQRATQDERQVFIALTPKGKALEKALLSVPQDMCQDQACDPKALADLRDQLKALNLQLQK